MALSLQQIIEAALAEDVAHGDVTTLALVPAMSRCTATLVAKQEGILSGMDVFWAVFETLGADIPKATHSPEGHPVGAGETVATFEGNTRAILSGERTALNFLQHLSGIATQTRAYAKALDGLPCRVVDTRKTTPLLRTLEKEAVRHGCGHNHRHNLTDGILIKENHIAAAGGIKNAVSRARQAAHHLMKIEIEVTDLDQLRLALDAGVDVVMLDNMDNDTLREAVGINDDVTGGRTLLEASGNVTLERIRSMAETGVNLISVGALTHSAPALDLSLLISTE